MKLLLTLLLLYLLINIVYSQSACGPPNVFPGILTFGPGCRYRCNCINNEQCDATTGECPTVCLSGWMGPACQFRNLAAAGNSDNSVQNPPGPNPPKYATDADITTCSRTGNSSGQRFLQIDLGSKVYIVGLIIIIPSSNLNAMRGFTIDVLNSTTEKRLCHADDSQTYIKEILEVSCFEAQVGRYIMITLAAETTEYLSVCDVKVFGGRLVSFNQPTSMDSIFINDAPWYGSYAVDGKVHSVDLVQRYASNRTCASSDADYNNPGNRWWSVDLLHIFSIQSVSFFARQDGNGDQYQRYYITISVDKTNFFEMFRDSSSSNLPAAYHPQFHNLSWPRNSRFLRVNLDNAAVMTLCEVEIFAECAFGKCGWDCHETCMCTSQTAGTHKILGTCPNGCAGRWTGINGKCNLECGVNEWGPECDQECGNCIIPCNVKNGTCPGPCYPGWEPPYCTQSCTKGKFGTDCVGDCGNCQLGTTCDRFTGKCDAGCTTGYKQPYCDDICDRGTFGDQCSEHCGHCFNGDSCHYVNGTCFGGCEAGYMGHDCKTICPDGRFGLNCFGTCGACNSITNCHKETGECSNGCLPGWLGRKCTVPCEDTFYGQSCYLKCGHCKGGNPCDPQTGHCQLCEAGYTGEFCTSICSEGRYGEGCQDTCGSCAGSEPCNITTGACPYGCTNKFTGVQCKEDIKHAETFSSSMTGLIIGIGVCIAAVILAAVLVGIFIYKRRKPNEPRNSIYTVPSAVTSVPDNNVYDVITSVSDEKTVDAEYINTTL